MRRDWPAIFFALFPVWIFLFGVVVPEVVWHLTCPDPISPKSSKNYK